MEIIIKKGKSRNTLTCKRTDGSYTTANIGPYLPNHDIAHYVIETKFKLDNGFYGKIKSGMTMAELSDKEVIKRLGSETWLSEIMARNLQSIGTGIANIEQFIELVHWEAEQIERVKVPNMNLSNIKEIKFYFDQLCEKWDLMPVNKELNLIF